MDTNINKLWLESNVGQLLRDSLRSPSRSLKMKLPVKFARGWYFDGTCYSRREKYDRTRRKVLPPARLKRERVDRWLREWFDPHVYEKLELMAALDQIYEKHNCLHPDQIAER